MPCQHQVGAQLVLAVKGFLHNMCQTTVTPSYKNNNGDWQDDSVGTSTCYASLTTVKSKKKSASVCNPSTPTRNVYVGGRRQKFTGQLAWDTQLVSSKVERQGPKPESCLTSRHVPWHTCFCTLNYEQVHTLIYDKKIERQVDGLVGHDGTGL